MALDTTIGGADADSYGTLAEYRAYAATLGWVQTTDDNADEIHLRRAAMAIDRNFHFKGNRVYREQRRAFPRKLGYINGWWVDDTTIPEAIKHAQFELAKLIRGGYDPFASIEAPIASETNTVGPITESITYVGGKTKPRLVVIEGLLRPYLLMGAGQAAMVRG